MATTDELEWKTLTEVAEAVTSFLNPALASPACGTWQPGPWAWSAGSR